MDFLWRMFLTYNSENIVVDFRERAKELMEIGNSIDDKIKEMEKLEVEIKNLQVYHNERGEQLLVKLIDSRNYVMETKQI